MTKPSQEVQSRAVSLVTETLSNFEILLQTSRDQWLEFYEATYVFETKRKGAGKSEIFFPKCYEHLQKISPRIFANNPKFVLSLNVPVRDLGAEASMDYMEFGQAALNYFWKIGGCQKKGRTLVNGGLVYGTMFTEVRIEQKTKKTTKPVIRFKNDQQVTEDVEVTELVAEYPTFEVPDIFDMYFDPRIEDERDYVAIIRNRDDVRVADLLSSDEYFNKEDIKNASGQAYSTDGDNLKLNRFSQANISYSTQSANSKGRCNIKEFYGYFDENDDGDEKFVKITVLNDQTVIGYKEVPCHPFVKFTPIDIPNQGTGVGVVAPIKKIQDGYNLTRNQRAENVSMVINRMWLMKSGAGIDPRQLASRAGNVISVKDLDAIRPLDMPDVTSSSFNEAASMNTDMQTILGTIDTTQDSGSNGFANLATGQKIRWNEFNSRFKAIRDSFEECLSKTGEKMLKMVAYEGNFDLVIENEVTSRFMELARSEFSKMSDFFKVSVLADSTTYDSIENRRDEVLALGQLAIAYKAQGLNIPLEKIWKDIIESYPGRDASQYLMPTEPQQPEAPSAAAPSQQVVDGAQVQPDAVEALNQSLTNM